eukprot:scaffold21610_cov21-Tisochrysis_lutea.AAC.8
MDGIVLLCRPLHITLFDLPMLARDSHLSPQVEVPKQSTSEGVSNGQADGFQSLEPGEMQRWRAGMESK